MCVIMSTVTSWNMIEPFCYILYIKSFKAYISNHKRFCNSRDNKIIAKAYYNLNFESRPFRILWFVFLISWSAPNDKKGTNLQFASGVISYWHNKHSFAAA